MAKVYDFVSERKDRVDADDINRVDSADGWVNLSQTNEYGEDGIYSLSPEDARWFAKELGAAAAVAGKHTRWQEVDVNKADCGLYHVIDILTGKCMHCKNKVPL